MFKPWVGSKFGNADNIIVGKRLLILGESHYTEKQEWVGRCDPDDTHNVVRYLAMDTRYRFFTTMSKLVTGVTHGEWSDEQNRDFWESVAFYNFVPVFLSKGVRPSPERWNAGCAPFVKILDEINPDTVIVYGLQLWWWVMNALPGGVELNDPNRDVAKIGDITAIRIPHPTGARGNSKYVYETFRPTVEEALYNGVP